MVYFELMGSYSFEFGRITLGMLVSLAGLYILNGGYIEYTHYFKAFHLAVFPSLEIPNAVQIYKAVPAAGGLGLIVSGSLVMLNYGLGAVLLILSVLPFLMLKLNPISGSFEDFSVMTSLIGAALTMIGKRRTKK
jgi:hypothetical protein